MAKMKLNKGVRSDHARYCFEVSSISATCSASGPCFAQWNEANAAKGGGQLLRSGRHPGDFGCRRTTCTLLDTLSAGGLRAEPIELGRSYCLDGEVVPEDPIGFLVGLPAVQVAPIVSVSCNLPVNPKAKGGHLVIFCGTRVPNTKGEVCCCNNPSTQGATVDEAGRVRFWSSFSVRALILKKRESLVGAAFGYRR